MGFKYITWLWKNSKGVRVNMTLRVLCGVCQVVLGLSTVWLSKRFIDETIRTGSNEDVLQMALLLCVVVVFAVVLRQLSSYMVTLAGVNKSNELRMFFYGCLFHKRLYQSNDMHSGDVSSRLLKDIDVVCDVMVDSLPQILVTTTQLVGAFLMMRWFDARLAWALLLLTPVTLVLGKLIARKLRDMTLAIRKGESKIQAHVQESVEHNEILRSFGSEPLMSDSLGGLQRNLRGDVLRRSRFTISMRVLIGCTFSLGYMLAFVWGGVGLRNGVITFGVMTSFLQLVGQIQHPVLTLLNTAPQVIHATASIDRLEELRYDEKNESPLGEPAHGNATSVEFDDVCFRYAGGETDVVDHFSHVFKMGSKTAIMGETGAGKTTLFRLMLGLVEPLSGTVKRMAQDEVIWVPQGNSLMSGSIRFNLRVAKPDATEEDMRRFLQTACAEFVFDLPQGLDTELGERGTGLSEGQAQRVAIARGLLHGGSLFLLDEISSALDEITERELYRRIFNAYPCKTMVLITHRSAVGELCDDVLQITRA